MISTSLRTRVTSWLGVLSLLAPHLGIAAQSSSVEMMGTNFRGLFIEAINAPSGAAEAEVQGPIALLFQRSFDAKGKLMASVRTIRSYRDPACKQLELTLHVPGATIPRKDGGRSPLKMAYQFGMCADGSRPTDMTNDEQPGFVKLGSLIPGENKFQIDARYACSIVRKTTMEALRCCARFLVLF